MPKVNVKASGITDMIRPKRKDESISPTIIVQRATGTTQKPFKGF
jgi:hypothetical protein